MAKGFTQRLRSYTQAHLGEACEEYNDVITELQHNRIHPSQNHAPKERIAFLQKFADEQLDYMSQIIGDLRQLK